MRVMIVHVLCFEYRTPAFTISVSTLSLMATYALKGSLHKINASG